MISEQGVMAAEGGVATDTGNAADDTPNVAVQEAGWTLFLTRLLSRELLQLKYARL